MGDTHSDATLVLHVYRTHAEHENHENHSCTHQSRSKKQQQ